MWRVASLAVAVIVLLAVILSVVFRIGLRRIAREDEAAAAAFATARAHAAPSTSRADSPAPGGSGRATAVANGRPERHDLDKGADVDALPITLSASAAKLEGSEIRVQEGREPNIGFWHHTTESAAWKVDVARTGLYHVEIVYACDPGNGGGVYEMQVGDHRFTGTSKPTGSWDVYNTLQVGDLTLTAGEHPIALKPLALDDGRALMNVRSIRIVAAR
jgi:hypothetical protein